MKSVLITPLIFLILSFSIKSFSAIDIACKDGLAGLEASRRGHLIQQGEQVRSLIPKEFQKTLSEPLQAFNHAGFIAATEIAGANFYRGSLVGDGLWGFFQERAVVWFIEKSSVLFVVAYNSKDNSWHLGHTSVSSHSRKNPSLINQKDLKGFAPELGTYVTDSPRTFVIVP